MFRWIVALSLLGLVACAGRRTCDAPVKSVGGDPPKVQPYTPASASAK